MDENQKNDSQEVQPEDTEQTSDESSETTDESKQRIANLEKEVEEKDKQISDLSRLKREAKREAKKSDESEETKSDEPDYAKLAFLEQKGVEHPDDQKIVKDEAERLKLPLTDILQMEHIKAKLQESKDGREAKEGMPKGKGRTGQASKEDIDYYLDKPDELPEDQELAGKVVEARLKKIDKASQFSDIPFIG